MGGGLFGSRLGAISLEVLSLLLVPAALLLLPQPLDDGSFDEAVLGFRLIGVLPCAVFYASCAAYALADVFAPPSWARTRKFQGAAVDLAAYPRVLLASLGSWFLVGLPAAWLVSRVLCPLRGCPSPLSPWDSQQLLSHVPACVLIVDAVFYATHRLLHSRALYAAVHARHHTFSAPFALAAVYAHPLEHLLSNVVSVSAGPLLLGSHPYTAAVWACLAVLSTTASHSGWATLWSNDKHDWHHAEPREHFGTGGMLVDRMVGTDTRYRARSKLLARQSAGTGAARAFAAWAHRDGETRRSALVLRSRSSKDD